MVVALRKKSRDAVMTGTLPYFTYIHTLHPVSKYAGPDAWIHAAVFRGLYFNMFYWAWFGGQRHKQGHPQIVISPKELLRATGDESPVVSRRSFFRWLKRLEEKKWIHRKRVADGGVCITFRVPKSARRVLETWVFDDRVVTAILAECEYMQAGTKGGTMVDSASLAKTIVPALREDSASLKTSRTIKERACLPIKQLTNTIGECVGKGVRGKTHTHTPPADDLQDAWNAAKEKGSGKKRYPVTTHRPQTENRNTREFSVRWWQDMVAKQGKSLRPNSHPERIGGHATLTHKWEAALWEEWYRVMETMILTWPEWLEMKNAELKASGKNPITRVCPPYDWSGGPWWDNWVEWDATQRAEKAALAAQKAAGRQKESFLSDSDRGRKKESFL